MVFRSFAALQSYSLRGQKQYPHRTSLALPVSYGFGNNDFKNHFFQAGLNAHWGVFGTDFKYRRLKDVTGTLEMADWLIGLFRIPIHQVNIAYGLGNIYILGEDQKYVNQAVGISIDLQKPHLSIDGSISMVTKNDLECAVFEISNLCLLVIMYLNPRVIHFYPTLEVNHQNYFDEDQFWLISAGLKDHDILIGISASKECYNGFLSETDDITFNRDAVQFQMQVLLFILQFSWPHKA